METNWNVNSFAGIWTKGNFDLTAQNKIVYHKKLGNVRDVCAKLHDTLSNGCQNLSHKIAISYWRSEKFNLLVALQEKSEGRQLLRNHPLETMDIFTKFYTNSSIREVLTKVVERQTSLEPAASLASNHLDILTSAPIAKMYPLLKIVPIP